MSELKYSLYTGKDGKDIPGTEAIYIYDDKIVQREATLFGHQKENVYPFTKIQQIYFHDGSFFTVPYLRLTIAGWGNVVLNTTPSNEDTMRKGFEYIQQRITELSTPNVNVEQTNQPSSVIAVADEIKALKELLDIGAITQEDFDAKKKQLLGL